MLDRRRPWVWTVALATVLGCTLLVTAVQSQEPAPTATATASPHETDGGEAEEGTSEEGEDDKPKTALGRFNAFMEEALFFDVAGGAITLPKVDFDGEPVMEDGEQATKTVPVPFLVVVLISGAIFFTIFYRFVNLRAFKHAIDIVRGKFDNPEDEGEISHFRALTSALSATVGLGNIAGVAVAIVTGGPGAVVWMMGAAIFAMSAKFSSCTLAQMYRQRNEDGSISGGPMYYLDIGLRQRGGIFKPFGKVCAVLYAIMVMGGALGGGNMFQANQTVEALATSFGWMMETESGAVIPDRTVAYVIGIAMAVFVGAVIIGGIKRIGAATSRIVPLMVAVYMIGAVVVMVMNITELPGAVVTMFTLAFSKNAFYGGVAGVVVTGVQRAAFSNEGGIGSAAIAHAAAKTDEPVREGMVAMLGPTIDTIIVCFMTAMVVIITGQWSAPEVVNNPALQGASVTSQAFASVIVGFDKVLSISIALFAYSTMVAWCYYGERGWIYLLDHFGGIGLKSVIVFRIIFVLAVVVGAVNKLGDVLAFSDIMILSMAFPNIIGSLFLAPRVLETLEEYMGRLKSGRMPTYDARKTEKVAS